MGRYCRTCHNRAQAVESALIEQLRLTQRIELPLHALPTTCIARDGGPRRALCILRDTTALTAVAEAEEAPSAEQSPPTPAEPAAPKAQEMYNQMAAWYNEPENAALRATWGAYPDPDAFQTWPGFVAVTNAFLDREAG